MIDPVVAVSSKVYEEQINPEKVGQHKVEDVRDKQGIFCTGKDNDDANKSEITGVLPQSHDGHYHTMEF